MSQVVEILRGPVHCKVLSTLPANVLDEIHESCSYEVEGAEHMIRSGRYGRYGNKWDGKKKLFHRQWKSFPSGLMHRVVQILEQRGYHIELEHKGFLPPTDIKYTPNFDGFEERDYQTAAIITAEVYPQGMIKIPTGGGKTYVAARIIAMWNTTTVFLVHTKDLLYQAKEVFTGIFGANMVGQVGDGIIDIKPITVMTIQTAARALGVDADKDPYAEDEDGWKDENTDHRSTLVAECIQGACCVMMDECHRVAAPLATGVVSAFPRALLRYGFSASPWRDDGADLALEAIFGHVIYSIDASTLIDQGHLVKPYIRFRRVPPQGFPKGTKYATIYDQYIVANNVRNDIVCSEAIRRIQKGTPTLVLVRRIDHGRELTRRISEALGGGVPFLSGKDDSTHRGQVIRDLRMGNLKALVATTIADEGLDIKPLTALILAGGGKSSTRALQRVGRVLRPFPGKVHAEVIDFEDQAKFLIDHSKRRLKIYETESNFSIMDV